MHCCCIGGSNRMVNENARHITDCRRSQLGCGKLVTDARLTQYTTRAGCGSTQFKCRGNQRRVWPGGRRHHIPSPHSRSADVVKLSTVSLTYLIFLLDRHILGDVTYTIYTRATCSPENLDNMHPFIGLHFQVNIVRIIVKILRQSEMLMPIIA